MNNKKIEKKKKKLVDRINDLETELRNSLTKKTSDTAEINVGKEKRKKYGKMVIQTDLSGNELKEFESIRQASEELKIDRKSISYCCQGKKNYNTAGGFKFKYKET